MSKSNSLFQIFRQGLYNPIVFERANPIVKVMALDFNSRAYNEQDNYDNYGKFFLNGEVVVNLATTTFTAGLKKVDIVKLHMV